MSGLSNRGYFPLVAPTLLPHAANAVVQLLRYNEEQ